MLFWRSEHHISSTISNDMAGRTPCDVCGRGIKNEYLIRGNKPPFKDKNADNPIKPLCTIHKRKKNYPAQTITFQTLLAYAFTTDLNPTTTQRDVSGSICLNNLLTLFAKASPGFASDPVVQATVASVSTTEALAVTAGSYFSFTISPKASRGMGFNQLTFSAARNGASTPAGYGVRSSIDNYTADIATANLATQNPTWTAVVIDLSAQKYQSLTTPVTFRIYAYGPDNTNIVDFDDITLTGLTFVA